MRKRIIWLITSGGFCLLVLVAVVILSGRAWFGGASVPSLTVVRDGWFWVAPTKEGRTAGILTLGQQLTYSRHEGEWYEVERGWVHSSVLVETPPGRWSREAAGAWTAIQEHINRRLKAPADASYPAPGSTGTVSVHIDEGEYFVSGWVDAPNPLGVRLRHDYIGKVKRVHDGWELLELELKHR
jgi:hypothetical protein